MKKSLRFLLLYPLSLIFGWIAGVRNFFFDKGILASRSVDVPSICVGNLAVGGTGKTPHTEYILSLFRSERKIAVLSRGYKRATKGFVLAQAQASALTIGDEPFQIHQKFPDVIVAVSENRVKGANELLKLFPDLELLVLDDAFQHRHIKSGFSILLTDYSRQYTTDHYLPYGRLRESKRGSRRADIIIVSKCPETLNENEMHAIKAELHPLNHQELFFSTYQYESIQPLFATDGEPLPQLNQSLSVLLVAGIVTPQKIVDYLQPIVAVVESLFFPDHHQFSKKDLVFLKNKFVSLRAQKKIIIVTEKDAARLISDVNYPDELKRYTFVLPISVKILGNKEDILIQKIKNYVKQNSRDCSIS